jgi:TRAP-type mannitol/chloroaromatic compound transport system substrate-binding protein
MVTSWPPALDVLQGNAVRFSRIVEQMSKGKFKIEVFAAGELIPAFGVFDAVSQGTLEMFNSAAYYWAGKEPATQWFAAMPFGLNAQGMNGWYFQGGALALWEKAYAPFKLVPRPAGSTGVQMGGWFRKKINSITDYKGLKFRIPGLGGKVIAQAGASVVLTPGGEVFPALERGVIDGTEWVGPHDDMKLGLHNAARYYYYPGWHEPGPTAEFVFNKKAYDRLPSELKAMLDYAAVSCNLQLLADYEMKNAAALSQLETKYKEKVEVLQFPAQVLTTLRKLAKEVVEEEAAKSPMAKKVHESFTTFQAKLGPWAAISEGPYQRLIRA